MRRLNVSAKNLGKFAGKWVAIDPESEKIIAASQDFKKIASLVSGNIVKKGIPEADHPYALRVPKRGEAPYILSARTKIPHLMWNRA